MAQNPQGDWRMENLISIADRVGLIIRKPATGSHYTFASPHMERIETVPNNRPIKAVYVRKFAAFAKQHIAAEEKSNERK